ncbi:MAG: aminotransferase class I/II-fold pyridoxal phosphate-dependent enzyme [Syntrophotaleaceae bacterium]
MLKTTLNLQEVIILTPYFVEYMFYIDNHGGTTETVTDPQTFQLDIAAIEAAIGSNTRALIINSPNNPTVIYPAEVLQALGEMLARKEQELAQPVRSALRRTLARGWPTRGTRSPASSTTLKMLVIVTPPKDLSRRRVDRPSAANRPWMGSNNSWKVAHLLQPGTGFVNAPALMQRLRPICRR